jgi:tRNA-2-methylthio-N6-dimethylallyladenosine synthase
LPGRLELPSSEKGRLVSAHVPIVLGCSRGCSYCIIPLRRGPERSRPLAEVVGHVVGLADQGVREVTLLGQIVDRYGHDRSEENALTDLLVRLDAVAGLERIRFLTSHPAYMTDAILDAVAELPKVMEHLEVPVQAGDDEILRRMRRGYTVDDFRRLVERARRRIPGLAVHTDLIVGFPGETESQFEATRALLAELRLDKAHIAKFSPRPGTSAARLADSVPAEEKELRRKALDDLQERVCAEINGALLGRSVEVLVEGRDRHRWRSRTRTGKLVFFADDRAAPGQVLTVRVVWAGPWSMVAEVQDGSREAIELIAS